MEAVMRIRSIAAGVLLASAGSALAAGAQVSVDRDSERRLSSDFAPPIDLWLDQVSYDRGARMLPYFTTEPGAYVTVVRVSSEGELRVMYPVRPGEQQPFRLGQFSNDRLPWSGDPSVVLHEPTGTGFVFAIASYRRFDYSSFAHGRLWNTARLASFGRYGDPFQIVRNFIDRTLPLDADYSLDYELYEVYSRGRRSVYGGGAYGSTGYWALNDYHDACLSAFGLRYSYYCRSYRGGYYGPIIVAGPGRIGGRPNQPRGKSMKAPRPLTHDPIVPRSPIEPKAAEGRQADRDATDRAAREYARRTGGRVVPDERRIYSAPRSSDPRFGNPRFDSPRRVSPQPEKNREPVIYHRPERQHIERERSDPRPAVGTQAPRERQIERTRARDGSKN
jgi:hypothetical protein